MASLSNPIGKVRAGGVSWQKHLQRDDGERDQRDRPRWALVDLDGFEPSTSSMPCNHKAELMGLSHQEHKGYGAARWHGCGHSGSDLLVVRSGDPPPPTPAGALKHFGTRFYLTIRPMRCGTSHSARGGTLPQSVLLGGCRPPHIPPVPSGVENSTIPHPGMSVYSERGRLRG